MTLHPPPTAVIGGIDTHKDTHTAVAIAQDGRTLGVIEVRACSRGYQQLHEWFAAFGPVACVGVEGTGSYGAGVSRFLHEHSVKVLEVNRTNRQHRRRRGKSDPADAEAAARCVLAGQAVGVPKSQDGAVEALRLLRAQRRSAIKARTQAANQLRAILSTAPDQLRSRLRNKTLLSIVKTAVAFRVSAEPGASLVAITRHVLRGLARRWRVLDDEVRNLDRTVEVYVRAIAPSLLERTGIGPEVASALLVAAGDNPERLGSESSFAALCGVSPVDASSGRQKRHRLNRAGNRDANRALWVIAFSRMKCDARTIAYSDRRRAEGLSRKEILRCLKRYIAREVFGLLRDLALPTALAHAKLAA